MIPSLLQIPSAVSDSKLHSVLPNNGKGDFTFDRSTGATRINKDGLIEEVGYFSSELVQNGNFSELGSELVTNGNFDSNSDWSLGTGWSINDGKAVGENAGSPSVSYLSQDFAFVSGKTYKVVYTVSEYVKGNVRPQLASPGSQNLPNVSANGTYTEYIVANNNFSKFRFRAATTDGGFTGKIDNVSVKQVDPNDRWTLDTGWSYGDGVANCDGSQSGNANIYQAVSFTVGSVYKVSFDVSNYSAGTVKIVFGDTGGTVRSANGNYVELFTFASGSNFYIQGNSSFVGTIDNISVVEVQGDRPRLSYDITNGVVEDKPHLLLEPSATNLVTFSEDFTQWNKGINTTVTANYAISPDGTQNATRIQTSAASGSYLSLAATMSNGSAYVFSLYIKNNGGGVLDIGIGSAETSGTNRFETVVTPTDEWVKYEVAFTAGSDSNFVVIDNQSNTTSFDCLIFGAQLEQQAYCTSYIPTAGTTITRAAETCNNSKPSVNSTEGVFYAEIAALADDQTGRFFALSDGSSSNRVRLGYQPSVSNRFRAIVVSGGSTTVDMNDTNTTLSDITEYNKIAFKYKVNDFALYFNGTEVKTDTSGAVPNSLNLLEFNNAASTPGSFFYGKVKGLAVYNEALSESQLMQLTGVTASSIYSNFVTRTASFTVEALNEVKKVIDNL